MPFSSRTMQPADWEQVAPELTPGDFRFPALMGYEFVLWLSTVRRRSGVKMYVSSDARSEAHNATVGGAQDSAHTDIPCECVDLHHGQRYDPADPHWNLARFGLITAALALGCTRVGIYANGSIHLDRTEDRRPSPRLWVMVDNPASP